MLRVWFAVIRMWLLGVDTVVVDVNGCDVVASSVDCVMFARCVVVDVGVIIYVDAVVTGGCFHGGYAVVGAHVAASVVI